MKKHSPPANQHWTSDPFSFSGLDPPPPLPNSNSFLQASENFGSDDDFDLPPPPEDMLEDSSFEIPGESSSGPNFQAPAPFSSNFNQQQPQTGVNTNKFGVGGAPEYTNPEDDWDFAEDDQVYYDSESEDARSSVSHGTNKGHAHSQPHSKPNASNSGGKISVISNLNQLSALSTFDPMGRGDPMYSIIEKYVMNSSGFGKSSGNVSIYGISRTPKGFLKRFLPNAPKFLAGYNMLLWFKTTESSVKHLARGRDNCVAFYDRIARAFPVAVRPETLTKPLRMTLLLCAVNLGTVHKSDKDYSYWVKNKAKVPVGHDSVKAEGRFCPTWAENAKDGSNIVPCGPTKNSNNSGKCNFDYSEYMVYQAGRVKVKYAVDVEIRPAPATK